MSRSENNTNPNPCTKWFEWSGSTGTLGYYDKERGEKVAIELPFTFLVLDQLATVTGWSDDAQSGIWSNEIRNTKTDVLTVRTKSGIATKGLYEDVKNLNGARYAKSIYIAYYDENKELQLGNLKASGACLSAWIEYCKGKDVYKGAVTLEGGVQAKKGRTVYFSPSFALKADVSDATDQKAKQLDRALQDYLAKYLHSGTEEVEQYEDDNQSSPITDNAFYSSNEDDDAIPF